MSQPDQSPQFITRKSPARGWDMSVVTMVRRERAGQLKPRKKITPTVRYASNEMRVIEEAIWQFQNP